jgi:hypothetical protein
MKHVGLFFVFAGIFGIFGCNSKQTKEADILEVTNSSQIEEINTRMTNNTDSIDLTSLIIKLLRWHETDNFHDFDVTISKQTDSTYSEIDWNAHKKRLEELKKTNLFNKDFIENYHGIALYIDEELRQNTIKYYIGETSPYDKGFNEWCNCQDYPDKWEDNLKIFIINQCQDSIVFQWAWNEDDKYLVKAKKGDIEWKISYLEGFDIKSFMW